MKIGQFMRSRSGEEHRSLTFAQLEVIEGDEEERTRLRYTSFGENNFSGGLKHRRINAKAVEQQENIKNRERCVVRLYNIKKYINKPGKQEAGGKTRTGSAQTGSDRIT